jgi:hypothetical protein
MGGCDSDPDSAGPEDEEAADHDRSLTVAVDQRPHHEQQGRVAEHRRGDGDADEDAREVEIRPEESRRSEDSVNTEAGDRLPAGHRSDAAPATHRAGSRQPHHTGLSIRPSVRVAC